MTILKAIVEEMEWICRDTAYNLEFIPTEKFDWKPAPTANSALDVANHVVDGIYQILGFLHGSSTGPKQLFAKNRAEAIRAILEVSAAYKKAVKDLKDKDLENKITLPWGERTILQVIQMPVTDMIHHHGQITYIQTLLGDTEMHFVTDDWKG